MSNAALQKEVQNLQSDMERIKELLEKEAKESFEDNVASISRSDIRHMVNQAGRSVGEFVGEKKQQATAATKQTEQAIAEHPFRSAALAFGAGALLSALFRK